MLEAYRKHVAERAEIGVVPRPLSAEQVAGLIDLLKQPPAGEEDFLLELLSHSCLLYTSPSPRDRQKSRMPSSA